MTVIRLIDGKHLYLHAVLDNYSRRILSWRLTGTLSSTSTVENLKEAMEHSEEETPKVLVDGGGENLNPVIDEFIGSGKLQRLLARTDIASSNAMIESWWRTLKHQWLFLNTLDSLEAVKKYVAFYVDAYNQKLPHSAFRGQTPDEMYFATGKNVADDLEAKRVAARQSRLKSNQSKSCTACEPLVEISK